MSAYTKTLAVLLSILIIVEAEPDCRTYDEIEVFCTAGKSDYQLVRGLVSDNNKTTEITLSSCGISDIEFEAFHDLNSLKYLDLSVNKIQALKLGVIDEPKQLAYLNLSYNQLEELPVDIFYELTNLEFLDLRGNRINKLELGIFDRLTKLISVDLSSNAFVGKNLNPYIFDQSPDIKFIHFTRNYMDGAPDNILNGFRSLEVLNLDRCLLNEVPAFATKPNLGTMKILILSTNQISVINNAATFVSLGGLELLDLSANNIESINPIILSPLKNLQKISLRDNKIKIIPDNLFKNMPKLILIDLYRNQLQDVPVSAFRGSSLQYLNLNNNKITYLQENFCLELRNSGSNLKLLLIDRNPWQCACLSNLIKEVKKLGIKYDSEKYDGTRPVCVTTTEFTCKRQEKFNEMYIDMFNEVSELQN